MKTTHRQMNLSDILGSIVCRELNCGEVHSDILCRKCFKLVDDIDSLEGQLVTMKQVSFSMICLTIIND